MTFEDWMKKQGPALVKDAFSSAVGWSAGQAAERERIKKIIDAVGWKVKHDAWLDCLDVILERIEDDSRSI